MPLPEVCSFCDRYNPGHNHKCTEKEIEMTDLYETVVVWIDTNKPVEWSRDYYGGCELLKEVSRCLYNNQCFWDDGCLLATSLYESTKSYGTVLGRTGGNRTVCIHVPSKTVYFQKRCGTLYRRKSFTFNDFSRILSKREPLWADCETGEVVENQNG